MNPFNVIVTGIKKNDNMYNQLEKAQFFNWPISVLLDDEKAVTYLNHFSEM